MIKTCQDCGKELYKSGLKCESCYRKIREAKRVGRPCSVCKRTDVLIISQKRMSCVMCERRRKIELDPSYKEKRKQWQRKHDRKKSGRPLDQPLIYAPSGSGHLNKYGYREMAGFIDEFGYRVMSYKNHPNASKTGKNKYKVREHTIVMCAHLGRPLRKDESIHHKNGIRDDNRIENLELWSKKQPAGQRVEDKIKWAIEFLKEYGYLVTKSLESNL